VLALLRSAAHTEIVQQVLQLPLAIFSEHWMALLRGWYPHWLAQLRLIQTETVWLWAAVLVVRIWSATSIYRSSPKGQTR